MEAVHLGDANYVNGILLNKVNHALKLISVILGTADSIIHKCANYLVFSVICIFMQGFQLGGYAVSVFYLFFRGDSAVKGGSHGDTSS